MNAQHTPGPWSVCHWMVGNNTPTGEITICGPEGDEHICTMDGNEDNQSNAALIAAAPDMLEALQRHIQTLNAMGYLDKLHELPSPLKKSIQQIQQAIAHAEAAS